jgi:hypothetical protein
MGLVVDTRAIRAYGETVKLTTRETVASHLLMNAISQQDPETKAKFERIMGSVQGVEEPKYDVRLTVNGEEFDLRAFEDKLTENLTAYLAEAAEEIFKQELEGIEDAVYEVNEAMNELVDGLKAKIAKMFPERS